jgi:hypothetical protein
MSTSTETFLAYWLGFADGNNITNVPASPDIVAIAFGVTDFGSTIATGFLTSKHSLDDILIGAKELQARGQKVVLSVSGDPNPDRGWGSLDPTTFAENAYDLIVRQWGFDGIDLDNEDAGAPAPSFTLIIKALRQRFGPQALITLPVYMGPERDAYLADVRDDITAVTTMEYWAGYDAQIELYKKYATLVGEAKVGIGVSNPGSGDAPTPADAIVPLAAYVPASGAKYGMMFWNLNSPNDPAQAFQWCSTIEANMPGLHITRLGGAATA